ncbi:MAG: AAA family ATPase [Candidatus Adiutrix sp.]|jgi:predicted ATP-binding protein involved in virulence|nr:AAA family ATPase [Candidatus Adiutrix sp.]
MKIEALHIENYRCFSDFRINFDERLTVLVGVNGSGKTAVLDAAAFFLKMYSRLLFTYQDAITMPLSDLKSDADSMNLSYGIRDKSLPLPATLDMNNYADFNFSLKQQPLTEVILNLQNYNQLDPLKLLTAKHREYSSGNCCLPITVYYTSKRMLNQYVANNSQSPYMKDAAYANAFSPQIDFSSSLAWFISKANEEARENQRRMDRLINEASRDALELQQLKKSRYTMPELSAVRRAISQALGEYDEPYVGKTHPKLFIARKGRPDEAFQIEQLSDGYRAMLALVMDLARRMAVANEQFAWPEGQTVLHSPGVVLIDEIELHLHPSWQQTVLPSLMDIFPQAQFIVTTHSPQVLTSIEPKHIRILREGKVLPAETRSYGAKSSHVLEDILGVPSRPDNEVKKSLDEYLKMINAGQGKTEAAAKLRAQLDAWLAEDPILDEADMFILRNERRKAREDKVRA